MYEVTYFAGNVFAEFDDLADAMAKCSSVLFPARVYDIEERRFVWENFAALELMHGVPEIDA